MSYEVMPKNTIRRQAERAAESDDRNGTKTPCPYSDDEFSAEWFDAYAEKLIDLSGEASA